MSKYGKVCQNTSNFVERCQKYGTKMDRHIKKMIDRVSDRDK